MNRLKTVVKEHALNEDAMLTRIRSKQHAIHKEEKFMPLKRLLPLGLAAALIVAVIASWSLFVPGVSAPVTTGTAAEKPAAAAYAMVAIDINPSFEIYIDKDENDQYQVVKILAVNKDAKDLYKDYRSEINDYIGKDPSEATLYIVQLAKDNGYLSVDASADEETDFVLVTTAILDADEDGEEDEEDSLDPEDVEEAERNQDSIGYQIQQAVQEALDHDPEGTVKVAVIKATLREVKFAEKDKIPLGLFIIKGMMIDADGDGVVEEGEEPIKVSDFVKSEQNVEALAKRATILERKADRNALKEERKAELGDDAADAETEADADSGKPESVPPVTPPGQAKKEPVASGS